MERATRIQGPSRAGDLVVGVAGSGGGAAAGDPGVSSWTMVTAHHDADWLDGCLIALQDPEELLIGAEQEGGVPTGEDGAPAGRVLEHALGGARERNHPGSVSSSITTTWVPLR
jgi:hypothetical protein